MAGTIGIKVANGSFYPIVGENYAARKKLVLTTVHDNQDSVQIDLFRSISKSMLDAQYIGSLVVEEIRPALKGEPSIEMIISAADDGNITAEAYDLDASPDSDHHVLNVSLKTMDTFTKPDDYPDFEMDGDNDAPQPASGSPERDRRERAAKRKSPLGVLAVAALLLIVGAAVLWFLLLRDADGDGVPVLAERSPTEQVSPLPPEVPPPAPVAPPPAPPPVAVVEPTPEAQAEVVAAPVPPAPPIAVEPVPEARPEVVAAPVTPPPPPVIQAPVAPPPPAPQVVAGQRPPAPVLTHRVPAVIPPNGVVYQIRWGDTLWDISAAFYRDPFLYPRIARHNNIRNPNLILAGFNVRIPPLD